MNDGMGGIHCFPPRRVTVDGKTIAGEGKPINFPHVTNKLFGTNKPCCLSCVCLFVRMIVCGLCVAVGGGWLVGLVVPHRS